MDYGPASAPTLAAGEPLIDSVWVEPYPDEELGLADGYAAPDARYEQREAVELAFIAALQHLPATQRAVLILREVLGFSAREVAESLDTTVASVNSALQRARRAVDERLPERSQQATLRSLGDARTRAIVDAYLEAWARADVEALRALLAEDAVFSTAVADLVAGRRHDRRLRHGVRGRLPAVAKHPGARQRAACRRRLQPRPGDRALDGGRPRDPHAGGDRHQADHRLRHAGAPAALRPACGAVSA